MAIHDAWKFKFNLWIKGSYTSDCTHTHYKGPVWGFLQYLVVRGIKQCTMTFFQYCKWSIKRSGICFHSDCPQMWKRDVDWGKGGNWFASVCFTVTVSGTISLNGCKERKACSTHSASFQKPAVQFLGRLRLTFKYTIKGVHYYPQCLFADTVKTNEQVTRLKLLSEKKLKQLWCVPSLH